MSREIIRAALVAYKELAVTRLTLRDAEEALRLFDEQAVNYDPIDFPKDAAEMVDVIKQDYSPECVETCSPEDYVKNACAQLWAAGYRRQAAQDPLTDEQLNNLRQAESGKLNFVTLLEFRIIARAVEAAHGIKEK